MSQKPTLMAATSIFNSSLERTTFYYLRILVSIDVLMKIKVFSNFLMKEITPKPT
jgi:hypothetical protein